TKDKNLARECYKRAGMAGDVLSQRHVFELKMDVKWLRMAAEAGDPFAQERFAEAYETGAGVMMDKEEAMKWYQKSAEQGYARAQCNYGRMFKEIMNDNLSAVKWYTRAALQGYKTAQWNLYVCYLTGR